MEQDRGFTMFELIISIVIVSILSALAYHSLLKFRQRTQISSFAKLLKTDMNAAKIFAAKANSFVVLQVYENAYELFVDDGTGSASQGDWKCEADEVIITKRIIPPSISMACNFPGKHLRFRSYGRNRPGTFILKGETGEKVAVIINAIGRIRIENIGAI